MAGQELEKMSDKELIPGAFSGNGERFAELTRRLKKSNERLTMVNIFLTIALLVVAVLEFFRH